MLVVSSRTRLRFAPCPRRRSLRVAGVGGGEGEGETTPIGSGVVESAIRRVVDLRVNGPCVLWDEENAERMLLLPSRLEAGRRRENEEVVA